MCEMQEGWIFRMSCEHWVIRQKSFAIVARAQLPVGRKSGVTCRTSRSIWLPLSGMFLKHVANKLRHDHGFSDLATSSPITEASSDALPAFSLDWAGPVTTEPAAQAIVSPLEPDYIHRPVTANGASRQSSALTTDKHEFTRG